MATKRSKSEERERKRVYMQNRTSARQILEQEKDKDRKINSRKGKTEDETR